jgi:hypothetical protein
MLGIPTARTIRCFHPRVPSPQKSRRLLLIKPVELLLFSTGADRRYTDSRTGERQSNSNDYSR